MWIQCCMKKLRFCFCCRCCWFPTLNTWTIQIQRFKYFVNVSMESFTLAQRHRERNAFSEASFVYSVCVCVCVFQGLLLLMISIAEFNSCELSTHLLVLFKSVRAQSCCRNCDVEQRTSKVFRVCEKVKGNFFLISSVR